MLRRAATKRCCATRVWAFAAKIARQHDPSPERSATLLGASYLARQDLSTDTAAQGGAPNAAEGCSGSGSSLTIGTPIPTNIKVDGSDPLVMERSAYPEWLWEHSSPMLSLAELERKREANGGLDLEDEGRYWKLRNRVAIRESNVSK